jgi:hypothetical protein
MIILLRVLFGGLLLASIFCFGASVMTGDVVWRRRGLTILKWTVVAGLVFFAGMILERLLWSA